MSNIDKAIKRDIKHLKADGLDIFGRRHQKIRESIESITETGAGYVPGAGEVDKLYKLDFAARRYFGTLTVKDQGLK